MGTYITDLLHNNTVKRVGKDASDWAIFEMSAYWQDELNLISITETEDYFFAVAIYSNGKPKTFCCSKKLYLLWGTIQETKLKITKLEDQLYKVKQKIEALVLPIEQLMHGLEYHLEAHAKQCEIDKCQKELDSLYEKFDTIRKDEKCL